MAVISDSEFLLHQGFLGSGYAALIRVEQYVQSGLNLVVDSTDVEVELDMLYDYNRNYVNVNVDTTANLLRSATEALERHVTRRTGQTFNDYLYLRNLKVSQDFAQLFATLGQVVDPANIQG